MALKERFYKRYGQTLSVINDLKPLIARAKRSRKYEWLKNYDSMALQEALRNLQKGYVNFFEKRAGKPRFKSRRGEQSSYHCTCVSAGENWIKIPKLGRIKARVHRPVLGKVKSITIIYETTGKYYASILFDNGLPEAEPIKECREDEVIGIDIGLKHLVTDSNGNKTENPKPQRNAAKKTKYLHKSLSRKKPGSKRCAKAKRRLARHYENVHNRREDYLHKVSRRIVDENQVVVAESLKTQNMMKNHCLAGAIADASFGRLLRMISYKAKREGKKFVQVGTFFPSSKKCSECGETLKELDLDTRKWTCPHCGAVHDRDVNAAKNIREEGIRMCRAEGLSVLRCRGIVPDHQIARGDDVRPRQAEAVVGEARSLAQSR